MPKHTAQLEKEHRELYQKAISALEDVLSIIPGCDGPEEISAEEKALISKLRSLAEVTTIGLDL